MDELARTTSPIIKLRDNWVAVDSAVIKRARKRLIRTITPVQALAATLTGDRRRRGGALRSRRRGEPAQGPRPRAGRRDRRARRRTPGAAGRAPRLPAPGAVVAGRADLARARCLPRRRHGPGQDGHPDRAPPAPDAHGRRRRADARRLPDVAARQLGGRDPPVRAGSPRTPSPRQRPRPRRRERRLRADDLRDDAQRRRPPRRGAVGPGGRRRGAAHQELPVRSRPGAPHDPERGPGRPHGHAGRERPHRAVVDPRLGDPRPARQPQRLPEGLGGADRVRPRAHQGRCVRRPDRPVPPAPPQVRPRHRARAAAQDRDRPPARPHPRAGRPLRDARPRVDAPHRGGRRGDPPRPRAQAAHRPQADLQPPRPLPAPAQPQAAWSLGEDRAPRRARRHGDGRGRSGPRLHPVRRDGAAARAPPRRDRRAAPVPPRRHPGARARGDGRAVPGRRAAGVPAVAQGGRHRAQPHPRRPRHPRRPLVEPRGRGPGDRPGLPDRPDPAGAGAPLHHAGHHRGEDRRAAHPQALAGRLGPLARRDRAHRALQLRAARPRRAADDTP